MTNSLSQNPVLEFQVKQENQNKPLREYVRAALKNYFAELEGHIPDKLYQMVLQEIEQPMLQAVLDYVEGNQTKAAEILGINRGTLRKKLKLYGLD